VTHFESNYDEKDLQMKPNLVSIGPWKQGGGGKTMTKQKKLTTTQS